MDLISIALEWSVFTSGRDATVCTCTQDALKNIFKLAQNTLEVRA
jgi:hypothetical protein